jgi:hypothetical protein
VGVKDLLMDPGSKFVVELEALLEDYRKNKRDIKSDISKLKNKSKKLNEEHHQYVLEYLIDAYVLLNTKYLSTVEDLPEHMRRMFEESVSKLLYDSPEEE